jgi:SAM-dependent methyltransferase
MNIQPAIPPTIDFASIKARQQAAWASGDYAVFGTTLQTVGEALCEAVDLRSNQRVLDVAAGNGNATLAAARRFAEVVSTDYVTTLLDRGRERARAEGLDVTFQQADAEALPFPDASYWTHSFARDGDLLSYAADTGELWRRAASYVDRILRGAKPAELPVQFPTKFELVIKLKSAKALGLTIPETLLATADEVIQ